MKYQIYLNKDTSMLINELAEHESIKPATYIKKFIESFMRIYKGTNEAIQKELDNVHTK